MRRLVALAAALAAALLVVAAPPASAGGPTSVLVVNYDGARASGALTGSTAYANLEKALDPYTRPTGERTSAASFMATQIRLTWMIHDVTPWRVDAISMDGDDIWVETTMDSGTGAALFSSPSVRHRPKDPALLVATLTSLGVIGDRQPATPARPEASAPAPAGVPGGNGSTSGSATDQAGVSAGAATVGVPWWATTASAVLALGLGIVLGRRVRPRGTPEPLAGHAHTDTERVAPVGFTTDADHHVRR